MKLFAKIYNSPLLNQGTFENVTIEDVCVIHKRQEKYIAITFEMYFIKGDQKIVLDSVTMGFQGMEKDIHDQNKTTSNITTTFSIINPNFDETIEESQQRITVPLFNYLTENAGVMPTDYKMIDFGFPTYEKVMGYFSGGTLDDPEIKITHPLAVGFLLNKLTMNGGIVGDQFLLI